MSYDGLLILKFCHKGSQFEFIVCSSYLPPEDSPYGRDSEGFFSHLLSYIYMYSYVDKLFICGDINARVGALQDYIANIDTDVIERDIIDTVINDHGNAFVEFLQEANMCIVNGRIEQGCNDYTFVSTRGRSVVDYIAVDFSTLKDCTKFQVISPVDLLNMFNFQCYISSRCKAPDHSVIVLSVDVHCQFNVNNHNSQTGSQICNNIDNVGTKKRYNFENMPRNFLRSDDFKGSTDGIIRQLQHDVVTDDNVDSIYNKLCQCIFEEMDNQLEFKEFDKRSAKKFKYPKPFWDRELTLKWNSMRNSEKDFRRCRGNRQLKAHYQIVFKEKQSDFDKCLRVKERAYYRNLAEKLEQFETNDPKKFWRQVCKLGPNREREIPMTVYCSGESGEMTSDVKDVLGKWETAFSKLLNPSLNADQDNFDLEFYRQCLQEKQNFEHIMNTPNYDSEESINRQISLREVEKMIHKIKNKKATGYDMLPNEVLKSGELNNVLLALFRCCFENGLAPDIWRKAIICPIPKGGNKDPHVPLNYRGISLLSSVYKVYTGILNNRLVEFCNERNHLVDEQNGFRAGRSCNDHLFTLTSIIRNRLNSKISTFCAFVDFQKAFDFIDRDLMLFKLQKFYGIDGNFYTVLKKLNHDTLSCVRLQNKFTDWFQVNAGVRQGDTLSPTLFSLFINDLAKSLKELNLGVHLNDLQITLLFYADDLVLFASNEQALQEQLNVLFQWCRKWKMIVNENKTKIVHFRPKNQNVTNYQFMFHNKSLEVIHEYRYLGIILTENLDFQRTAKLLAEAGGRAFGMVRNKLQQLKEFRYSTFSKLYNMHVRPILEYGSEIWGYKSQCKIDNIQHRAIRFYFGVHRFAPIHMLEGDIGWVSTICFRHVNICKFYNRIIKMSPDKLTRKVFECDLSLCKNNWSFELKQILSSVGCNDVIQNRTAIDIRLVKQALQQLYCEKWENTRFNKPKLRYYNIYKISHSLENYAKNGSSRLKRSTLAQFCGGILPINVDIGHFRNIPLESRLFVLCNSNLVSL